jgi:hypothetical protein
MLRSDAAAARPEDGRGLECNQDMSKRLAGMTNLLHAEIVSFDVIFEERLEGGRRKVPCGGD